MFVKLFLAGRGTKIVFDAFMFGSELCIFLGDDHPADRVDCKHLRATAHSTAILII
jgi:hypothetical protein